MDRPPDRKPRPGTIGATGRYHRPHGASLVFEDHRAGLQLDGVRSGEEQAAIEIVDQIAAPYVDVDGTIACDDFPALARRLRDVGFETVDFPSIN
jgi:hypothetical protein